MSDSCVFQLKEYFVSNPYRKYTMAKPYMPKSAHSRRLSNSSFEQLFSKSETLDRMSYKLRMKSHLNVDNLNETCQHHQQTAPNPPIRSAKTTKTTRTETSKSTVNEQLNGIEGNAVRVRTLKDLIRQYRREEARLVQQPDQYLDYPISTNFINDRIISKPPAFLLKQTPKQAQIPSEYRFDSPTCLSKRPQTFINQSTINRTNPLAKRIETSRAKIRLHTEKQVCICNKLNIVDPYADESSKLSSNGYIFPPIRAFGYFRRKSIVETPLLIKKKNERKKRPKTSSDVFTETNQSLTTITDLDDDDDDIDNPPNTRINIDFK